MKLVCISDTHGKYENIKLPKGDVLIHAGDITTRGSQEQLVEFCNWLKILKYKYIILIAGNHDKFCQISGDETKKIFKHKNIFYLNESGCEIEGIKFWGSPWTPKFGNWFFNIVPGEEKKYWEKIPLNTDVLITHGPRWGILDENTFIENCGCPILGEKIDQITNLKAHIFGHIHESYGTINHQHVKYVNASVCNFMYVPENLPIIIDV